MIRYFLGQYVVRYTEGLQTQQMEFITGYAERLVQSVYHLDKRTKSSNECQREGLLKKEENQAGNLKFSVIRDLQLDQSTSVFIDTECHRDTKDVVIEATLLKNGLPLTIRHPEMRRNMFRLLSRTNSCRKVGGMFLDPLSGRIKYRYTYQVSFPRTLKQTQIKPKLQYINQELFPHIQSNFQKIISIMRQLQSEDLVSTVNEKKLNGQAAPEFNKTKVLMQCVENSHHDFPREYLHDYSRPERRKQPVEQATTRQFQNKDLANHLETFAKYISSAASSTGSSSGEPLSILSQINIKNAQAVEWQLLTKTNLSCLHLAKVTLQYLVENKRGSRYQAPEFSKKQYNKLLVKKVDLTGNRINREKEILRNIGDEITPYFIKTYIDDNKCLYSDYSQGGSYEKYCRSNKTSLSLMTKLFGLCQVAQGIRFLHGQKVAHCDLKPQNVLLGRNLNLKLTDLGEAIMMDRPNDNYHPGISHPYTSPEIHKYLKDHQVQPEYKSDVFSFGVMLMEALFDEPILTANKKSVGEMMTNGSYFNRLGQKILDDYRFGPKSIVECLYMLARKCLDPEPCNRPTIQWIIVVLRQSFNHIQRLY